MSKPNPGPSYKPAPAFSPNEPIEQVRARVHGRLLLMLMALVAVLASFLISMFIGRPRTDLTVADCLPPGVSLETRLGSENPGMNVGQQLEALGVQVQNGVLIDRDGVPIGFSSEELKPREPEGLSKKSGASKNKMGMQSAYRVITISKFDPAKPSEAP